MNQLKVVSMNGQLVTDSREVAEMIDKEHAHLLRDIRTYVGILGKSNFGLAEFFIESYYNDSQGKPRPHFFLTKKGCDMVANKMTGEKGVLFTAAYVMRFEEMEMKLRGVPSYMIDDPIKRAEKWIEEKKQYQAIETKAAVLEQRVAEYEPKISYLDTILNTKDTVTISQIADDYGMSGQRFNKLLHEIGVQYKMNGQWLLYSKFKGEGYTKSQTLDVTRNDGSTKVVMNTRWTQKGRLFLYEKLKNHDVLPLMDLELDKKLRAIR